MAISMITATAWVPRGYAAGFPSKHEFDQDELERISRLAKLNIDDAKADLKGPKRDAQKTAEERSQNGIDSKAAHGVSHALVEDEDELKEYDLEHYDDEPANNEKYSGDEGNEDGSSAIFGNIKALAYHQTNDEDPYITLREGGGADSDEDDREDLEILATDNLLLSTRMEDEMAQLEVHVYEDNAANLYVHHDILLPAVPLCVEWFDYPIGREHVEPSSHANFVAVGTMDPDIELWDLDTTDSMFPSAILGANGSGNDVRSSGKKKKKSKQPRADQHTDAVLALAANRQHRNLLASASADTTVKLWDLTKQACAQSYAHHKDKVCSLAWHPREATAMLTGSYDRTAAAADMRAPEAGVRSWTVDADVESVRWDPHDDNHFYVSTEGGMLHYFDARAGAAPPVWRLQAHEKAVTSFAACLHVPGLLATGSDDRSVKLWDARGAAAGGPALVVTKELDVGRVFSVDFAPDAAVGMRLAAAGSKGALRVWDTGSNKAVRGAFGDRVPSHSADGGGVSLSSSDEKEQIVGVDGGANNSDSDSDSEDDEEGDEADSEEDMEVT